MKEAVGDWETGGQLCSQDSAVGEVRSSELRVRLPASRGWRKFWDNFVR